MNKTELITAICRDTGVTKKDADSVIRALTAAITEELKAGGRVQIPELGSFKPVKREARTVRNPRTGESIESPACTVVKFSPAKALKEAVK